ncbi:MAG: Metal-sensitive transcriptional repressor [Actinomycetota bacterium]|jgi:hypothetical protein
MLNTPVGYEEAVMVGYVDDKEAILKRLKRAEGQVRGILATPRGIARE